MTGKIQLVKAHLDGPIYSAPSFMFRGSSVDDPRETSLRAESRFLDAGGPDDFSNLACAVRSCTNASPLVRDLFTSAGYGMDVGDSTRIVTHMLDAPTARVCLNQDTLIEELNASVGESGRVLSKFDEGNLKRVLLSALVSTPIDLEDLDSCFKNKARLANVLFHTDKRFFFRNYFVPALEGRLEDRGVGKKFCQAYLHVIDEDELRYILRNELDFARVANIKEFAAALVGINGEYGMAKVSVVVQTLREMYESQIESMRKTKVKRNKGKRNKGKFQKNLYMKNLRGTMISIAAQVESLSSGLQGAVAPAVSMPTDLPVLAEDLKYFYNHASSQQELNEAAVLLEQKLSSVELWKFYTSQVGNSGDSIQGIRKSCHALSRAMQLGAVPDFDKITYAQQILETIKEPILTMVLCNLLISTVEFHSGLVDSVCDDFLLPAVVDEIENDKPPFVLASMVEMLPYDSGGVCEEVLLKVCKQDFGNSGHSVGSAYATLREAPYSCRLSGNNLRSCIPARKKYPPRSIMTVFDVIGMGPFLECINNSSAKEGIAKNVGSLILAAPGQEVSYCLGGVLAAISSGQSGSRSNESALMHIEQALPSEQALHRVLKRSEFIGQKVNESLDGMLGGYRGKSLAEVFPTWTNSLARNIVGCRNQLVERLHVSHYDLDLVLLSALKEENVPDCVAFSTSIERALFSLEDATGSVIDDVGMIRKLVLAQMLYGANRDIFTDEYLLPSLEERIVDGPQNKQFSLVLLALMPDNDLERLFSYDLDFTRVKSPKQIGDAIAVLPDGKKQIALKCMRERYRNPKRAVAVDQTDLKNVIEGIMLEVRIAEKRHEAQAHADTSGTAEAAFEHFTLVVGSELDELQLPFKECMDLYRHATDEKVASEYSAKLTEHVYNQNATQEELSIFYRSIIFDREDEYTTLQKQCALEHIAQIQSREQQIKLQCDVLRHLDDPALVNQACTNLLSNFDNLGIQAYLNLVVSQIKKGDPCRALVYLGEMIEYDVEGLYSSLLTGVLDFEYSVNNDLQKALELSWDTKTIRIAKNHRGNYGSQVTLVSPKPLDHLVRKVGVSRLVNLAARSNSPVLRKNVKDVFQAASVASPKAMVRMRDAILGAWIVEENKKSLDFYQELGGLVLYGQESQIIGSQVSSASLLGLQIEEQYSQAYKGN